MPLPTQGLVAELPQQLSALLGQEVGQIRKTSEQPPRVSIIDVIMAVSGGSQHDAARTLRRLSDQYPEVGPNWPHLKFKGRGQRDTPVTHARGVVEIPRAMVKTAHPEQKASSAKTQPVKTQPKPPMKTQRTQSWEATAKYVSGQMYQLSRGRPVTTGR